MSRCSNHKASRGCTEMIFKIIKIITCELCKMKLHCSLIYNGWYCDSCCCNLDMQGVREQYSADLRAMENEEETKK